MNRASGTTRSRFYSELIAYELADFGKDCSGIPRLANALKLRNHEAMKTTDRY